jgi:mono/diheme cytochrome c family protein
MPKSSGPPQPFEPAWLERSLDRYYLWGLSFMVVLLVAFPIYKLSEPQLRRDATQQQLTNDVRGGAAMFQQSCSTCHGPQATGGTAPTLNSKQFLNSTSDAQIELLVTGGVSGSSMSAWSLDFGGPFTTEQIHELVNYLRSLEPAAPSVPDWRTGAKAK